MSADRWFLMDRQGRWMVGFRTRCAGRRWLRKVGNGPAVEGWMLVSSKDVRPVIER